MEETARAKSTNLGVRPIGLGIIFVLGTVSPMVSVSAAPDASNTEDDGTVHVRAFDLPESSYLSQETRSALKRLRDLDAFQKTLEGCPPLEGARSADVAEIRRCQAEAFYETDFYTNIRRRYPVAVTTQTMNGVYTEIFAPREGVARENARRVLIDLHGGNFSFYARINSHLESVPIAAVGRIKVVSIDYRQAPEYTFPAASEDVAAVYQELLKTYEPKNIGIYGCSAGGLLTAESIAWFQKHTLPLPGAVGIFCAGAGEALDADSRKSRRSDSGYFAAALSGAYTPSPAMNYFRGVDQRQPLVNPGDSDELMSRFPPTLLISGTRDMDLSSVVATHSQLVRLGVEADLHVWEGMEHAFLYFPQIPESREAYSVIVKFFDRHLRK